MDTRILDGWPERDPAAVAYISNILYRLRRTDDGSYGGKYYDRDNPDILQVNILEGHENILPTPIPGSSSCIP